MVSSRTVKRRHQQMVGNQIVDRVQQVIEQDRAILDTFGMTVLKALDGECVIRCQVPAGMVNAAGFAHGAIVYALMDTGCAYALGSTGVGGVTIHGDVKYVKGGQAGSNFEARVNIASRGRRVATLQGQVHLLSEGSDESATADSEVTELAAFGSFVFQLRTE